MKCLIFSDSHGSEFLMQKALRAHKDAEVVFFLGDGLSGVNELARTDSSRAWIAVRGNCDFSTLFLDREANKTEEITLEGKKIVATHGDIYGVKAGVENLESLAYSRSADIVLFGHTHIPFEKYSNVERPIYLFNPGSVAGPSYSFGILTLTEDGILFSHGRILY